MISTNASSTHWKTREACVIKTKQEVEIGVKGGGREIHIHTEKGKGNRKQKKNHCELFCTQR
jgi:hypothetical protein